MVRLLEEVSAALYPGVQSNERLSGFALVEADRIPEPCRSLLAHDRDMTGTLEEYWGGRIHIEPLEVHRDGDELNREVVLVADDGRQVEAGGIRIRLGAFPEAAREEILGNRKPLGAILTDRGIPFVSKPRAFFRIATHDFFRAAFPDDSDGEHYGRYNVLSAPDGAVLAEVVEILPVMTEG